MVSDGLRRFVEDFLHRREVEEGFNAGSHSYYIPSPRRLFLQFLLTGHIVDTCYMPKEDIVTFGYLISREVLEKDFDFYIHAVKYARYLSVKKDPPLIALIVATLFKKVNDDIITLLSTYNPKLLIERYYNVIRSGVFPYRVEISKRYVRKILTKVVERWEQEGKLRYFAIKYPRRLATLVKLVMDYVKIDDEVMSFLFFKGNRVSDPILKARLEFKRAIRHKEKSRAYELIVEHNLPFSLARQIPYTLYDDRIFRIMSPYDIAMFCDALYRVARGEKGTSKLTVDGLIDAVLRKGSRLPLWYIARVFLTLYFRYGLTDPVVETWSRVWKDKLVKTSEEIAQLGLGLEKSRILLIVDASGSMHPRDRNLSSNIMIQGLMSWVPFYAFVNGLIMFSKDAFHLDTRYVKNIENLVKLIDIAPSSSTCIHCALRLALEDVKRGEYTHVILITDEQANVIHSIETRENDLALEIARHARLIVHNPQPYPAHVIEPTKEKNIIALYGKQPEDILASMILSRLYELDNEEEIIRLVKEKALQLPANI